MIIQLKGTKKKILNRNFYEVISLFMFHCYTWEYQADLIY